MKGAARKGKGMIMLSPLPLDNVDALTLLRNRFRARNNRQLNEAARAKHVDRHEPDIVGWHTGTRIGDDHEQGILHLFLRRKTCIRPERDRVWNQVGL